MHSRLYAGLSALTVIAMLSGCAQATRHSNTMIFGTNTQFGIRAGAAASSVPEVNVGYSRQEAVILPLVANTEDDGAYQTPCNIEDDAEALIEAGNSAHPCLLVAVNGKARDSYSVLASFGAKFSGDNKINGADQTNATGVNGGLAQYFATGVAAQILALNGGASVIAVGDAAKESATRTPENASTIAALFGGEKTTALGVQDRNAAAAFQSKLKAKMALTPDDAISQEMKKFETAAGVADIGIAAKCASAAACQEALAKYDPYRKKYSENKAAFDAALKAWKTDS